MITEKEFLAKDPEPFTHDGAVNQLTRKRAITPVVLSDPISRSPLMWQIALPEDADSMIGRLQRIPTEFHPSARGCRAREVTLVQGFQFSTTPTGCIPWPVTTCRNPVGHPFTCVKLAFHKWPCVRRTTLACITLSRSAVRHGA